MALTRGGFVATTNRMVVLFTMMNAATDVACAISAAAMDGPGWIDWNKTGPTGWTRDRKRINHEDAYSMGDACTNWAEESFSRMRRAGDWHRSPHCRGVPLRYAQERFWRGDNRRLSNGQQVNILVAIGSGTSKDVHA